MTDCSYSIVYSLHDNVCYVIVCSVVMKCTRHRHMLRKTDTI